jgi:MacB-like periplasmic core domain/FtsX-like permease family
MKGNPQIAQKSVDGFIQMGVLRQNISYAIRTLLKNKGFMITAVLTLALGIGATTAIFSVVYAVFEPMPYPNPDQLVMVWSKVRGSRNSVPSGDFLDWQRRSTSFQGMGAWIGASFNVATDDRPEQVAGSRRTPGFFTFEGLPFSLGRDFLPEEGEPGKDHVVILSNRLWRQHFNADPNLIGKDIRMNGEPYTVVGVLPPDMHDRFNSQLWVPLSLRPEQITHGSNSMLVMARLKDGVTIEQAQAEMNSIAAQLQSEYPQSNANRGVSVEPLHLNFVTESTRRNLWLLLGAVGFLLLIGCVNVANLLLARGTSRQREVTVRAALGASRSATVYSVRGAGFREDNPEIYVPFAQSPWPQASMVVRTDGDPKAVIRSIAAAVNSIDPDLPLAGVRTIDEIVSESLAIDRFSVVLFASFGVLGLMLAAVGIYGVMAFAVAQRTHEFGVRMALGAQQTRVIRLVLKEGTILAISGTVIGLGGAYLVGRAMQSTLYGVQALDVRSFAAVSLLLLVAALLACLFPALRASRIEPLVALRAE